MRYGNSDRRFWIRSRTSPKGATGQVLHFEALEARNLLTGNPAFGLPLDSIWQAVPEQTVANPGDRIHVQATDVRLFDINEQAIWGSLATAPLEFTEQAAVNPLVMSLAAPDGTYQRFEIVESPIIEEELAAIFPDIKTYRGIGLDDPLATVRLDTTMHGFHAQVLSANGSWYIDPYFHLETEVYASYFRVDALVQPGTIFGEAGVLDETGRPIVESGHAESGFHDGEFGNDAAALPGSGNAVSGFAPPFGNELRVYQTAIAATGEYTAFHGGTVAAGQAAIVTALNRVNGLYEIDLSARMILVGNNNLIVYTNSATDPYTNNNGVTMLGQNQSNLDAVIGSANYDLGHVFSTGGGGVASLGVIGVNGSKARGVTGLTSPIGDPFYVDYVAHEMGHQYGANHTFNGDSGSCAGGNRNGSTAYEPGSGTTIMAYAGICGNDNLQLNSDAFFHSESIDEIRDNITTGSANAAAQIIGTANNVPTVNAGGNFVIPAGTPFELTAVGNDADAGDVLTFSWEQRDLGPQQDVSAGDNGSSPLFRAWSPTENPTRVFPRLTDLLANTTVIGETLPTTNRTMNFRAVVRDNSGLSGGVSSDDMTIQVVVTGQAFQVTSQNTAATWLGGTQEIVSWNVAGTDGGLVNTSNVDILLSVDGGLTYNTVLASGVPNDGSQSITVPNVDSSQARIKVRGSGNIFFDLNDANITVQSGGPGVILSQTGGSTDISEAGLTDAYSLQLATAPSGTVQISASADTQSQVSLDGVAWNSGVIVSFTNTGAVTIFVRAVDDSDDEGTHFSTISHQIVSSGDLLNYPLGLSIPDVVATIMDNDGPADPILIGVDFGPAGSATPTNWTGINASATSVTLNDLFSEDGSPTTVDITVTEDVDGSWNADDPVINASTLVQHANDLTNLAGQIWSAANPLTVTWSDLNVDHDYQVYVFGLEGFYSSIRQRVTITGAGDPFFFDQTYDLGDLFINNQVGDSNRRLQEYAVVVTPNASGQIIIDVDPLTGGNDVVLGGVAISEIIPDTGCDPGTAETLIGPLNYGVAAADNATGGGFLMYSAQRVQDRFGNRINPNNADHVLAVRWNGSQWQYTNKDSLGWRAFTPVPGDRLLAAVDFSANTVTSLEGSESVFNGVNSGFLSGDLSFAAEVWNGTSNAGEFAVSGTLFEATALVQTDVTPLNYGVAAADNATGTGFLMYSSQRVQDRFGSQLNPNNADHLIAVRLNGSQWQFTNKDTLGWIDFTPESGDRLLAEVDFSADTINSLEGADALIGGLPAGYVVGDLVFSANVWRGRSNSGEFGVTGSFFDAGCGSSGRASGFVNGPQAGSGGDKGQGSLVGWQTFPAIHPDQTAKVESGRDAAAIRDGERAAPESPVLTAPHNAPVAITAPAHGWHKPTDKTPGPARLTFPVDRIDLAITSFQEIVDFS